jgi:glycerol-3-phosphate dehydrogenase subunit C
LHIACHARAQNMGQKATEMLRLIPDTQVNVIERCSGHGASRGVMKGNFETALKVGRPVFRQALRDPKPHLASECPLAAMHILQGMQMQVTDEPLPPRPEHPVELLARAYGISPGAEASGEPAARTR